MIKSLKAKMFFYIWNESKSEARLMTSFDTTIEELDSFVALVSELEDDFKNNTESE